MMTNNPTNDLGDSNWCVEEMKGLDLCDERLKKRVVKCMELWAKNPSASIPQACEDWAATKASYNLLDHENVTCEKLLAPHQEQTILRMKQQERVFAIQDTTYLDLTHFSQMEGVGPIGTEKQNLRGLVMHSTIAVTETGLNLGVIAQDVWAREKQSTREKRKEKEIEEKESYKWLAGLKGTPNLEKTEVITICDRESDVYEFFVEAQKESKKILIRGSQNRALMPPETKLVFETVRSRPVVATIELSVSAKNNNPARETTVTVRFASVTLKPPSRSKTERVEPLPPIDIWVVLVEEVNPPEKDAIQWLLYTNVPVHTTEDALERVRWYCIRWQIEIWHKILKSGCRIEHRHLHTVERYQLCLVFYLIIAWRIHWMTHFAREQPDAPCTAILSQDEWQTLFVHVTKQTHLPVEPPTAAQAVLWIACLGGFMARKGDGQPGVTVLWRGWTRLQDLVSMWKLLHPSIPYKVLKNYG